MAIIDITPIIQMYQATGFSQWVTAVGSWIISSPFFKQFGLLVLFIWEASPTLFIPIPLLLFIIPLLYAGVSPLNILLVALGGSVIGNLSFYYIAKYSIIKLTKGEAEEFDNSHFLHKHRSWIFVLAPLFFITGDGLMIYAGAKKMPIHQFVIPLFIGNAIRVIVYVLIALGLLSSIQKLFL